MKLEGETKQKSECRARVVPRFQGDNCRPVGGEGSNTCLHS